MSARNRELLALVPASLLVAAGFAAIFIQESQQLSDVSLTYGAVFLGVCVATHLVVRIRLPYADPYLLPLAAVLACFGLVVIYRLDPEKAIRQAGWVAFRLGAVWVEGQLAQVTARPGTGTAFLVLRDPAADVSLQLTAPIGLIRDGGAAVAEGSRVVVHGKPSFFLGRGTGWSVAQAPGTRRRISQSCAAAGAIGSL